VPIHDLGHREACSGSIDIQVDEGIETGFSMQYTVKLSAIDGDRLSLHVLAVHNSRNLTGSTEAPRRAAPLGPPGLSAQRDFH
jgi:hypothetical protein